MFEYSKILYRGDKITLHFVLPLKTIFCRKMRKMYRLSNMLQLKVFACFEG